MQILAQTIEEMLESGDYSFGGESFSPSPLERGWGEAENAIQKQNQICVAKFQIHFFAEVPALRVVMVRIS